jgi:O-antigen ligase
MKAVRIGLCTLFAFSVFAHGVVEVWSESVLEIGASVLLVAWVVLAFRDSETAIHWNPLNWPFLGFIAIGLLQLAFHWSANPFFTRVELLRFSAYFIVFFLCAQVFREREDLVKLAWFLVVLGFSVGLLGIIQFFTSPDRIYWIRSLPPGSGNVFGPYVNRNNFAGFVELVAPIGLALLVFRGVRRDLIPMAGLLTIIPVGALILSASRAGIICFAFEVAVLALLARTRKGMQAATMIAVAFVGLTSIALIVWLGAGKAIERFSKTRIGEVTLSRRASMFRGAEHIFLDHPVKGVGLGAIVTVFPGYDTGYDGLVVDHVHNDYIEAVAETGILGGLCGIAFLWLLFTGARRSFGAEQGHFSTTLHAGAIAAVCGILLHSFVEFNLHIPSNALLFLLQAYLATSAPLPSEGPSPRRRLRMRERTFAQNEV